MFQVRGYHVLETLFSVYRRMLVLGIFFRRRAH